MQILEKINFIILGAHRLNSELRVSLKNYIRSYTKSHSFSIRTSNNSKIPFQFILTYFYIFRRASINAFIVAIGFFSHSFVRRIASLWKGKSLWYYEGNFEHPNARHLPIYCHLQNSVYPLANALLQTFQQVATCIGVRHFHILEWLQNIEKFEKLRFQ